MREYKSIVCGALALGMAGIGARDIGGCTHAATGRLKI
jgi:hypothetical protein